MTEIGNPDLAWRDGRTPESRRFGDVYFSAEDGLAEARYVFLGGIGAPDVWRGRQHFAIGETGFGTGLNFLAAWHEWSRTSAAGARLDYVSVEGYPVGPDDILETARHFPELGDLAARLAARYPVRHPGFHRLEFDGGRVSLTLLFDQVEAALRNLRGRVDAWFLDGFAPARNPGMWSDEVLALVAERSRPGARLATFTAAGRVRRSLAENGFEIEKRAGFGRKRDCLAGTFIGTEAAPSTAPWFRPPDPPKPGSRVAVIGAGVAGAALADGLAARGFETVVFERNREIAPEASGNPTGLLQPRARGAAAAYGRFLNSAYLHARGRLETFGPEVWAGRGVLSMGRDADDFARQVDWFEADGLPDGEVELLSASEAGERAGVAVDSEALWFPKAGVIRPREICRSFLGEHEVCLGVEIGSLERAGGIWRLLGAGGKTLGEADAVVLANGPAVEALSPSPFPIFANRGQITMLTPSETSRRLQAGLSFGGYLTPAGADGAPHVLGATFGRCDWRDETWRASLEEDDAANLEILHRRIPFLRDLARSSVTGARASLRATTEDRLPVVGAVPDADAYRAAYANLKHGPKSAAFADAPYVPGLYVFSGFGSRGFSTAPLAAALLADLMAGSPLALEGDIADALHPGRSLVRTLKRG